MIWKTRGALPCTELDAEGTAAAAGALHVGIVEFESRTFERLDVIDLNPVQIHGTHLVGIGGLGFKRHVVLETGAAATHDSHSQSDRRRVLHAHDFLYLGTRNGRQINHKSSWPPLAGAPAKLSTFTLYQNFHAAAHAHVPVMKRLVSLHFDKLRRFAYNWMQ